MKLRYRFTLFVLIGVGVVTAVMAVMTFQRASDALLAARQDQLLEIASSNSAELARRLNQVSQTAWDLSATLEVVRPRKESQLLDLLEKHLQSSGRIHGLVAAYQPYQFDPRNELFCLYLLREPDGIKALQLGSKAPEAAEKDWYLAPARLPQAKEQPQVQNYPRQDWYLLPMLLRRPLWIQPFFGEAGKSIITTYSSPIIHDDKVVGVVAAEITLSSLGWEVANLAVGRTGYAFLITHQGTFVAAPTPEWVMRETIFSLAEELGRPDLRELGKAMVAGDQGLTRITDWRSGKPAWLAYAPVQGLDWSLGVVMTEAEVFAPVEELARWLVYLGAAGVVALILVVWFLVLGLTKPLDRVVQGANRLASGDLTVKVEGVPPGDEMGELAQAFNTMVDDLNRYLNELTTTTAAKERIESELNLARKIQESILPRTYPAFPDRPEFDLYARTIPAREVGGDFYDYFMVGTARLGLVLGDVSGKGIPAALFMTVARSLLKSSGSHHVDPTMVLQEVNEQILPENDMCMFVTIFYAVYNPETGRLVYTSAGHPPPILRRASGAIESLDQASGIALGVTPDMDLKIGEAILEPGDMFLAFTDGLDEAINPEGEMFSIDRARRWLSESECLDAPSLIDALVDYQREFTGDVEQFDDLTMLLFKRTK